MEEVVQKQEKELVQELIQINDENPYVLLCAYGTLRDGKGNWSYLLKGNSELLGTFKTSPNFTMFGKNAGFPVLVDKGGTAIECDVFKISSNDVLKRVHSLEGCTGIPGHKDNWYDVQYIDTPYGKGIIYIQHDLERFNEEGIIKSGNWNTRNI